MYLCKSRAISSRICSDDISRTATCTRLLANAKCHSSMAKTVACRQMSRVMTFVPQFNRPRRHARHATLPAE